MTKIFIACYVALMILLALTVGAYFMHFHERLAFVIAMGIAIAKALLVGWYFMDLRRGPMLLRVVVLAGAFWLFFFYSLGATDIGWRRPGQQELTVLRAGHGP